MTRAEEAKQRVRMRNDRCAEGMCETLLYHNEREEIEEAIEDATFYGEEKGME